MFGDFVDSHKLLDVPLLGARFTWSKFQENPSMSRLDYYLIFMDWEELFLPRPESEHSPLVLQGKMTCSGPRLFRFQPMWLLHPGFKGLVVDWWNFFEVEGPLR